MQAAHTAHRPLLRHPGPGYQGITQDICEERGCCWVPVDFHGGPSADLPWCAGGRGGGGSTPSCWHLGQGLPCPSRPLARSALLRMKFQYHLQVLPQQHGAQRVQAGARHAQRG